MISQDAGKIARVDAIHRTVAVARRDVRTTEGLEHLGKVASVVLTIAVGVARSRFSTLNLAIGQ